MPVIARGEENTISNINWFTTVNYVLTNMYSMEFQIFRIEAGLPGTQIFPTSGWADVTNAPGRFDTGCYYAYDTGGGSGWTPELDALLGTHRISWRWKLTSGSSYQTGQEDFEVLADAVVTTAEYLTLQDLYNLIGSARVKQLFDDDINEDLTLENPQIQRILNMAEHEAASRMLRSWTSAQILAIAQDDEAFRGHVAWIALEFASERRPEFNAEDGKGRFWAQQERAIKYIEQLSKGITRSKGEASAGRGANVGGNLRPTDAVKKASSFVFAPSEEAPTGHGGY